MKIHATDIDQLDFINNFVGKKVMNFPASAALPLLHKHSTGVPNSQRQKEEDRKLVRRTSTTSRFIDPNKPYRVKDASRIRSKDVFNGSAMSSNYDQYSQSTTTLGKAGLPSTRMMKRKYSSEWAEGGSLESQASMQ